MKKKLIVEIQIDSGPYGPRLELHGPWHDSLREVMREKGITDLYLNHVHGWQGEDLSFLESLAFLRSFKIVDWRIRDISGLQHLVHLKSLQVNTRGKTIIDFSRFKALEDCGLDWWPGAQSISECTTLKSLYLYGFKEKSFDLLSGLKKLESLRIKVGAPARLDGLASLKKLSRLELYVFNNIADLSGIEHLENLEYLELNRLPKLASLAGLEKLKRLATLAINTCKKIKDFSLIANLQRLRRLHLDNDGSIESVRFVSGLKKLETFSFIESTNVLNGDLNPVMNHPGIKEPAFQNRKHYSHRREVFEERDGKISPAPIACLGREMINPDGTVNAVHPYRERIVKREQ